MKTRNIFALIINIIIVILVTISVASFFSVGAQGNMTGGGFRAFIYFTTDSNVLCGICALILGIYNIKAIFGKSIPKWVIILKMVGTVAVTVTLMTVLFFLGPTMGYKMMFMGANLYMHLITPLLSILSFIILDPIKMKFSSNLYSCLPTLVYAIIYYFQVILFKNWHDFYGFNSGFLEGLWYVSFPVMLFVTFVFSYCIYKMHNIGK